jgi:hypothetical protein
MLGGSIVQRHWFTLWVALLAWTAVVLLIVAAKLAGIVGPGDSGKKSGEATRPRCSLTHFKSALSAETAIGT